MRRQGRLVSAAIGLLGLLVSLTGLVSELRRRTAATATTAAIEDAEGDDTGLAHEQFALTAQDM
jgi:hypothetical protein